MKEILLELLQVSGVLGFALFDETGVCLDHAASPHQLIVFRDVLARLETAWGACKHIEPGAAPITSLVVRFVRGGLVLSSFGANKLLLLIDSGTNEAMVSIGLQVVAAKLSALPPPQSAPARPSQAPPPSYDTAGAEVVRELARLLTIWVGPFAKVHVQQELRAMGTDILSIAWSDFEDLAIRLATKIPEAHERRAFLVKAEAIAGTRAR